jgi:hypothetical protein
MERKKMKVSESSGSLKVAENAYAQLIKIKNVEDLSNYPWDPNRTPPFKTGFSPQLLIKVFYDVGEFEKSFLLFGKYQKKNSLSGNPIAEWNTWGNSVHNFLGTIYGGEYELEGDGSIPFDVLTGCIDKEIYAVRYVQSSKSDWETDKGERKPNWQVWDVVFTPEATLDEMKAVFAKNVDWLMKNRDYAPTRKLKDKKEEDTQVTDTTEQESSDEPFI